MVEGGDLHLPVGKPVKVLLRSIDVLHDFYVPEFRAKMDMVPGMVTYFWFTPTRTGTFEVLCAELCGVGHAVDARHASWSRPRRDYQAWLDEQPTFAQASQATARLRPRDGNRLGRKRRCGRSTGDDSGGRRTMVDAAPDAITTIPPAEVADVELYHPHSWWTKYVFCQDAKVIAIQYSGDRDRDRHWWRWCCPG